MSIEINDLTLIPVLNRTQGEFCLQGRVNTPEHSYFIPERISEDMPSETAIPFADIKYINNLSDVFRSNLDFDEEFKNEVYSKLGINGNNIENELLDMKIIKDMILNPTTEKLNKITKIKDVPMMEMVHRTLIEMLNATEEEIAKNDIPQRSIDVIDARYDELVIKGVKNSEIKLVERKTETKKKEIAKKVTKTKATEKENK